MPELSPGLEVGEGVPGKRHVQCGPGQGWRGGQRQGLKALGTMLRRQTVHRAAVTALEGLL